MRYRILIADDEGIMTESLRRMIEQNFGEECEVATVRSGREAIEQAELFHPDIVFMDIQMPGINGIDAIKEIRKFNSAALFYVISAYDKFDYAKEAIALGVERYIMKPVSRSVITSAVTEAIGKVDEKRRKLSDQLKVQEKLETIIPVVENGYISSILMQNEASEQDYYRTLLEINENYGYIIVFEFGTEYTGGRLVSPVKTNVTIQDDYARIRAVIKSFLRCVIGSIISNRITVLVPFGSEQVGYEERVRIIENVRATAHRLEDQTKLRFRAGIGRCHVLPDMRNSYREALQALSQSSDRVVHNYDLSPRGVYEDDFPIDREKRIFELLSSGEKEKMQAEANAFFDWMITRHPDSMDNIRLKILEYVLQAEKDAFHAGAINYGFDFRKAYLTEVMALDTFEGLRKWFIGRMTEICTSIRDKGEQQSESVVSKAKNYITEHFADEISLDDVSREVNVSPYYFSRLFKEEAGENFIDYLTGIRVQKAKQLLRDRSLTIREVSQRVGYSDPNYFSRMFKKQTDLTPREYREGKKE